VPVLVTCFFAGGGLATLAALELELLPAGTVAFLGLAAALGAASGATFALVARLVEPAKVGSVTGVVGAAGGLGGFVPPLLMGAVYGSTEEYTIGLLLLAVMSLLTGIFTWWAFRSRGSREMTEA
jgi:NNP family nitrate/nitrite transporter-like MFS transporter